MEVFSGSRSSREVSAAALELYLGFTDGEAGIGSIWYLTTFMSQWLLRAAHAATEKGAEYSRYFGLRRFSAHTTAGK